MPWFNSKITHSKRKMKIFQRNMRGQPNKAHARETSQVHFTQQKISPIIVINILISSGSTWNMKKKTVTNISVDKQPVIDRSDTAQYFNSCFWSANSVATVYARDGTRFELSHASFEYYDGVFDMLLNLTTEGCCGLIEIPNVFHWWPHNLQTTGKQPGLSSSLNHDRSIIKIIAELH